MGRQSQTLTIRKHEVGEMLPLEGGGGHEHWKLHKFGQCVHFLKRTVRKSCKNYLSSFQTPSHVILFISYRVWTSSSTWTSFLHCHHHVSTKTTTVAWVTMVHCYLTNTITPAPFCLSTTDDYERTGDGSMYVFFLSSTTVFNQCLNIFKMF